MSPFLSRLACWIFSLTDKHNFTLILAYIPTHFNVKADFLTWVVASRVTSSSSQCSSSISTLGYLRGESVGILIY